MKEIIINNTSLGVKEYNGQRVVTFKDIDVVHHRPEGTARRNFNKNKKYFIEGEDYFVRNSYEAKTEFGIIAPNGLMLITETGYYMLVKSFTDDLSWAVQRELTNCYFRVKDICKQLSFQDEPEYEYFDKTFCGIPVLTVKDISHMTGVKKQSILWYLSNKCVRGLDYCVLKGKDMDMFKKENPKFSKKIFCLTIVAKLGFLKLCEVMGIKHDVPDCYCIEEKKKPSNDMIDKILNDFGIRKGYLTKENSNSLLDTGTTITGNSVLRCSSDGKEIFCDSTSDYYERLSVIMKNIGQLILGRFRKSIDDKPVPVNGIDEEAGIFSATFLALKLFADYGGFTANKN